MPWKETDAMKERAQFVLEWERRWNAAEGGRVEMAELCRMYGISRQTGYVLIRRYRQAGFDLRAVEERSRRPLRSSTAISPRMEDLIVQARKARPRWGPRTLRAWLQERHPNRVFPQHSAISALLKRRGLTTPRKRRRRRERAAVLPPAPFSGCTAPNAVWCIDFKGWFRVGNGHKCHPLTIVDAFSRYLIRCEILVDPTGTEVQRVLDSAFLEFGLPAAIRSDNGPPFAAAGPLGLSRLSVWLLRLGIELQRIQPGKPQQNGRQERFHLTLKNEAPVCQSLAAQQRAFDEFRARYNHERPHQALGLVPPDSFYRRSRLRYPTVLLGPAPAIGAHQSRADKHGFILWQRRKVFISAALAGEFIGLFPLDGGGWEVLFGPLSLGTLDERTLGRGLQLPRRRAPQRLTLLGDRDDPPLANART